MPKRKSVRDPMTEPELINHLVAATGLNRKQVKQFFDELASVAHREVRFTGEFVLPGLGTLIQAKLPVRKGRNPMTGEPLKTPARGTVKFRARKSLGSALKGDNTTDSDI